MKVLQKDLLNPKSVGKKPYMASRESLDLCENVSGSFCVLFLILPLNHSTLVNWVTCSLVFSTEMDVFSLEAISVRTKKQRLHIESMAQSPDGTSEHKPQVTTPRSRHAKLHPWAGRVDWVTSMVCSNHTHFVVLWIPKERGVFWKGHVCLCFVLLRRAPQTPPGEGVHGSHQRQGTMGWALQSSSHTASALSLWTVAFTSEQSLTSCHVWKVGWKPKIMSFPSSQ